MIDILALIIIAVIDTAVVVAIVGIVGTITAAYIAARGSKKSSEDNIVISREQGARELVDSLTTAQDRYIGRLTADLDKCREQLEELRNMR